MKPLHSMVAIALALLLMTCLPSHAAGTISTHSTVGAKPANSISLAQIVCAVLHALPAERKQACCGTGAASLAPVCEQALEAALKHGSVSVDPAQIEICAAATSANLEGCDWVGPQLPPLPPACGRLINGALKTGAICRSSLECNDGMYCRGVTPLGSGICAAPAIAGARCEIPADNLRSFTQTMDDPRHPTCDGVCLKGQCLPHVSAGAECASSTICVAGLNCIEGRCTTDPLPAIGQACSDKSGCANSAICASGHCAAPKTSGQTCKLPFECRSLECDKPAGAESGVCADVCSVGAGGKAFPL